MNWVIILGKLASWARRVGLGPLQGWLRDRADHFWMLSGRLPLGIEVEGFTLGGLYRHRSFLAHVQSGYELYSRQLFKERLQPGIVVIDGGAHIGLYSLIAAQKIGGSGKVFAFEPDPFNFYALTVNLKVNSCRNVVPLPKALSSSSGKQRFYSSTGTIGSSIFRRLEAIQTQWVEVDTSTIDNELAGHDFEAVLIKLDLEGAEPLAIQGAVETITRASAVTIFAEINPLALRAGGFTPKDLVRALTTLGLQVYFVDEGKRRLIPITELTEWSKGNLLACKNTVHR